MDLPTVDDVRPILRKFELRMRTLLDASFAEWMEMPDRGRFSPRTRASAVYDIIRRRAIAEFDGDPDVRVMPKGQTVRFLFRDRVVARFKKANSKGLGSNIETQAVIQFIDPQIAIPDLLPDIYKVEVCYKLDRLGTKIDQMTVAAREKHRRLWHYDLEAPPAADVASLPLRDLGLPPAEVRVRKPKDDSQQSE